MHEHFAWLQKSRKSSRAVTKIRGPRLLWAWAAATFIENKSKIEPKVLPCCTIPLLLIAYTWKRKMLATALRAVARTEQRGHVTFCPHARHFITLHQFTLRYVTLPLASNAYFVDFRVAFRISNFCFTNQLRNWWTAQTAPGLVPMF